MKLNCALVGIEHPIVSNRLTIQRECKLPLGDANIIWKAAGGFAVYSLYMHHPRHCICQQQNRYSAGKHSQGSMDKQESFENDQRGPATVGREEIAMIASRKLTSPSSYGKPNGDDGWEDPKLKMLQKYMCFHRFAGDSDKQATPVVLLDPILAQVSHDCQHATPTAADCSFTALVASKMSEAYPRGDQRMKAFWGLLENEFHVCFERAIVNGAVTDGSFKHLGGLLVNLVVKNEVGSGGGAPHVQNAAYAASHAFQAATIRRLSVCPTLLIELAGPNMSLSGAVFTDIASCDQLSPMVSLLWQPHSRLMLQAARCFAALRRALPSLRSFYEALDKQNREHLAPTRQLEFPYSTSFTGAEGNAVHLHYVEKISSRCFKARLDHQEGYVLVKFCKSYSQDAHICLASNSYALNFIALQDIIDGWLMVMMEFVDGCLWDDAIEKPLAALQDAVQLLHGAGFVHGDLRPNNILVTSDGVRIIDFEWAGVAEQTMYPFFMNHLDVEWPEGATDGQPIKQDHDLWWLHLLSSQPALMVVDN